MLNQILLSVLTVAGSLIAAAYAYSKLEQGTQASFKTEAEIELLEAQAAHVRSQVDAEAAVLKETIAAYEKQGQNKLRTQLARESSDLDTLQKTLGFKIAGAISFAERDKLIADHEKQLEISRKIVADLEDRLDAAQNAKPSFLSPAEVKPDHVDEVRAEAQRLSDGVNVTAPSV